MRVSDEVIRHYVGECRIKQNPQTRALFFECWLGHFNFNAKVRLGGETFATQTVHKVRQGANVETNDASPMQ